MKKLHIHINVDDLDASIKYYTALFGVEPIRREADYAKWLLDDPAANVAISNHGRKAGVDHVGISLDSREELEIVADRLQAAGGALTPQEDAACCYARSDKYWSHDPHGAVWELFHTFGDSDTYGKTGENPEHALAPGNACCAPAA